MGVKNIIQKIGNSAGNKVAKLSKLSSEQIAEIQNEREKYLEEIPNPDDIHAIETTQKLMAACSVEIFNAYLPQIKELYLPVAKEVEYGNAFITDYNIRYFNITKWVTNKDENNIEKLVNVYAVLSDEDCNIALIFNRTQSNTNVYLAVVNTGNVGNNTDVKNYRERLLEAIRGNFPGAEFTTDEKDGIGRIPCLDNNKKYSIATASNIPNEKSEKFISQTIEKLLDGIIPDNPKKEYTLVLLATPIRDIENRKMKLGEFYSGLVPYASWQTNYQYSENTSRGSSATVGVNIGASAGIQNGQNYAQTDTNSNTDNSSITNSENSSETNTTGDSLSTSTVGSVGMQPFGIGGNVSTGKINTTLNSIAKTTGKSIANTLGKAVTKAVSLTSGITKSIHTGGNFGANFARSSTITAMIGKNEGITQSFENFNIKHALTLLEEQMKRLDQSSALGMWDFAAYVVSEDPNVAQNVAHTYLALTQGNESYMSHSAINLWKGNVPNEEDAAKEIVDYIRDLRHPIFGLNKEKLNEDKAYNVYPSIVTATTSLSGKELAYSLNFPQKSIAGLPVLECAEFGRNVITYDTNNPSPNQFKIGQIFHMNHVENNDVTLNNTSLASHTFIAGTSGSGKSNTIYKMLNELKKQDVKFLVIEPAKGEYKNVFGKDSDVTVYGTNPLLTKLLRINPFSFPKEIHVLEHLDRLVELFNVCWPMYAAMPAVLKDAIEKSYIECGWDMVTSTNTYHLDIYPTFEDVTRNIKAIIEQSDFDSDNKGAYKGSLLLRLQSLTNGMNRLIFTHDEISYTELFDENVIVDLSRVGSTETKSLIMGMLVMKLQEYRMSCSNMNSHLKHITVLEEAHNLLKRTSTEQISESSNLLGKSVEMLTNAIAEMRTYGEGFMIADQSPALLDMAVIRNTNTKIILRLPEQSDRVLVGKSANLNDEQITELSKLPCGVAAIYQNEWVQPVLCKVDKFEYDENYRYADKEPLEYIHAKTTKISESLLDCIMNKELLRKDNKEGIENIKLNVINSRLSTKVKVDLLNYIESSDDKNIDNLRVLLYDLLSSEKAIESSRKYNEIHDWIKNLVNELKPSIKNYSNEQIDLAIALILYEKTLRDSEYNDLFCRFSELYKNEGGVYKWVK